MLCGTLLPSTILWWFQMAHNCTMLFWWLRPTEPTNNNDDDERMPTANCCQKCVNRKNKHSRTEMLQSMVPTTTAKKSWITFSHLVDAGRWCWQPKNINFSFETRGQFTIFTTFRKHCRRLRKTGRAVVQRGMRQDTIKENVNFTTPAPTNTEHFNNSAAHTIRYSTNLINS